MLAKSKLMVRLKPPSLVDQGQLKKKKKKKKKKKPGDQYTYPSKCQRDDEEVLMAKLANTDNKFPIL